MKSSSPKKVLVIDDNEFSRLVAKLMLEKLNCEVETADAAEAALKITQNSNFSVVLIDYHMPGMNGVECVRQIRQQATKVSTRPYIIAATSDYGEEVVRQFQEAGVDAFIDKPFSINQLKDVLSAVPERKAG